MATLMPRTTRGASRLSATPSAPLLSSAKSTLIASSTTCFHHPNSRTAPARHGHSSTTSRPIPPPTPFVPDVRTFLTLIGRQLSAHASKIPSWDALFRLSSSELRDAGLEPPRARRYLLWWRERYRNREFGVGGELPNVVDGVAELRAVPQRGEEGVLKGWRLVNRRPVEGEQGKAGDGQEVKLPGVKVGKGGEVMGPYWKAVAGTMGRVVRMQIEEGMWEVARGHKLYGGERRRKYNLAVLRRKAKAEAAAAKGKP